MTFADMSVDLDPKATADFPGKVYKVNELDDSNLVLTTAIKGNKIVTYHFKNQKNFPLAAGDIVDNGLLVVQHIQSSKLRRDVNKTFEYQITNDPFFLKPTPTFVYPAHGRFGDNFTYNLDLPKNFELEKISTELTVDFDVSEEGASNFRITQGIGPELDEEVLRVMQNSEGIGNPSLWMASL